MTRTVLWWGRSDADYARNRILRDCLLDAGWRIVDHRPLAAPLTGLHARVFARETVDLVWVPAFRQRDITGAARWARARSVPLLFDPLISAWDKQVGERARFAAHSVRGRRLLAWERRRFALADAVLADTAGHESYFRDVLGVDAARLHVVPVGADETLFTPQPWPEVEGPLHVLFHGSFLRLQGPEVIVEAARLTPPGQIRWHLLGAGPLLDACRSAAAGLPSVRFEPWMPYEQLPARLGRAEVLLGIFGGSDKAQRVVPNKVYQALACARAVVTARSPAYPRELLDDDDGGLVWVPPADAAALAATVQRLATQRDGLAARGRNALAAYHRHFDHAAVCVSLARALASLGLGQTD